MRGRIIDRESASKSQQQGGASGGSNAITCQAYTASHAASPREDDAPSDQQAIARAQAGDHDAFRVLVERYQDRVYRLALRVLRDEEQARDAVQEAFLKVYRSIRRFEGRSSFYTWLYRLVMNLCVDIRRRDRSDRHVEWREELAHDVGTAAAGGILAGASILEGAEERADQALERAELRERLAAAIAALPEIQRETLILREVDGLSYAEIAEVLEISKGTVMSRLHYARRKLQLLLGQGEES